MAGKVQLGREHSNPHVSAHCVCSTESFQEAFGAQHWLHFIPGWLVCNVPGPCGHHHSVCACQWPQPQSA